MNFKITFNQANFISKLHDLPEEIVREYIFPKLSPETLVWLNREYYIKHHDIIYKLIPKGRHAQFPQGSYEAYIRYMVRNDYSFVFKQILDERKNKWVKMRKFLYKAENFTTYLHFLANFAFNNASYKCEQLIISTGLSELGEKWYKKSKIRNIKWSN